MEPWRQEARLGGWAVLGGGGGGYSFWRVEWKEGRDLEIFMWHLDNRIEGTWETKLDVGWERPQPNRRPWILIKTWVDGDIRRMLLLQGVRWLIFWHCLGNLLCILPRGLCLGIFLGNDSAGKSLPESPPPDFLRAAMELRQQSGLCRLRCRVHRLQRGSLQPLAVKNKCSKMCTQHQDRAF